MRRGSLLSWINWNFQEEQATSTACWICIKGQVRKDHTAMLECKWGLSCMNNRWSFFVFLPCSQASDWGGNCRPEGQTLRLHCWKAEGCWSEASVRGKWLQWHYKWFFFQKCYDQPWTPRDSTHMEQLSFVHQLVFFSLQDAQIPSF